ncbi:MAG: nucleoside 2-deoxyribosyltransferase [Planctomycetes bacterium]|nr:nucleoside 2-deoxyribosyltransferase [Planctomycetota bacterium]
MAEQHKTCFVICPLGEENSDVRRRTDLIFKHIVMPAIGTFGFAAIRADRISEPGIITSQIIQHIIEDDLVIADLTGRNPNVFYELAIRHSIRKPLVQIIQKGEQIPFDVAGMRTISVDHRDLDSVEAAKCEIEKQIESIMKMKLEDIESPISVSLDLQALRSSDRPEDRSMAEFVSEMSELRTDVKCMYEKLSSPEDLLPPRYLIGIYNAVKRDTHKAYEKILHDIGDRMDPILDNSELPKELLGDLKSLQIELRYWRPNIIEPSD